MQSAPLYTDVARAPERGVAHWLHCDDGVRVRAAHWLAGSRGTVFLFPGRTEYIEKYGAPAAELAARGFASVAIDWRGQGLADRPLADGGTGHVARFADYQRDVAALLDYVTATALPKPYYLVAHSMGGCIGLRALVRDLPVRAVAFSAPMWGLSMRPHQRPLAQISAALARAFGQGHRYVPGTGPVTYVREASFDGNTLTSDPEMYAYMRAQVLAHPDLELGGPSLHWLHEAFHEMGALRAVTSPAQPTVTALGSREAIVDPQAIRQRMARWPGGTLDIYEGAEHEVIMETPAHRGRFFDRAAALFAAHS